jgi:diguanylate cyclase (GGDEF)-like protein/PAS domain S-box-containing protein
VDWYAEAYVGYPTAADARLAVTVIPTFFWGLATLTIEILSFAPTLAPPDPWAWRLGLGIPAAFVFAWLLWLVRSRHSVGERTLQFGLLTVWSLSALVNFIVLMITPATQAVLMDLVLTSLAAGLYFLPRVVVGQMLTLAAIAAAPLYLSVPGHHPEMGAWLVAYLPAVWLVVGVAATVRLRLNKVAIAAARMAQRDALTGLANRDELRSVVEEDHAGSRGGLLLIDLDNFKAANTLYGHPGGDHALRTVAQALLEAAGPEVVVARIGGDEMAVYAPSTHSDEQLQALSRTMRAAVCLASDSLDMPGVELDASIGTALRPRDGDQLEQLLDIADRSMYAQKATHARHDRDVEPAARAAIPPVAASTLPDAADARRGFTPMLLAGVIAGMGCATVPAIAVAATRSDRAWGWAVSVALVALGAAIAVARPSERSLANPLLDAAVAAALVVQLRLSGGFASPVILLVFPLVVLQAGTTWSRSFDVLVEAPGLVPGLAGVSVLDAARSARPALVRFARLLTVPALVVLSPFLYASMSSLEASPATIAFILTIVLIPLTVVCSLYALVFTFAYFQRRARREANNDPLTGLPNRRAFTGRLGELLEREDAGPLVVVAIDLDNFGEVNNVRGHHAGDVLLREIAAALRSACREQDFLARIGGDEFASILRGVDAEGARALADRYVAAVTDCTATSGDLVSAAVTASAGFAIDGDSVEDLLSRADEALMQVKRTGKGRTSTATAPQPVEQRAPAPERRQAAPLRRRSDRGWRTAIGPVVRCWRDPSATPELATLYRTRQYGAMIRLLPVSMVGHAVLLASLLAGFWGYIDPVVLLSTAGLMSLLACVTAAIRRSYLRAPRDSPVSDGSILLLSVVVAMFAAADAVLFRHVFADGGNSGRLLMTAIGAGVLAAGGWLFAHMPRIAASWIVPMSGLTSCFLIADYGDTYLPLALLTAFYGMVIGVSVLFTSREYLTRLKSETEIDRQRELLGLLLHDVEEDTRDWLWETDAAGRLRRVSARLARTVNRPEQELRGVALLSALPMDHEDAHRMQMLFARCEPFRDAVVQVAIEGRRAWWSMTGRPLTDGAGSVVGWRGVSSDVTQAREQELQLRAAAEVDGATGVASRHHFLKTLGELLPDDGEPSPCTLLLLDLDDFKTVNDSLGHSAGDELLRAAASRLRRVLGPKDLLARLGGDEFAILRPTNATVFEASRLAERAREELHAPLVIDGRRIEICASVAICSAPRDAATARELLRRGDLALHAAKDGGRDSVRAFEPAMEERASRRLALLGDLREAVRREQFLPEYQPQLNLATGAVSGYEALVRWRHPERGVVVPDDFIGLAEESGLIEPLGEWVLMRACADATLLPSSARVAVNVSARQFEMGDVAAAVSRALQASGLAGERLIIEITESSFMRNPHDLRDGLYELRALGAQIALDDFGTGYSSLSYLPTLPLNQLKIDRSFVSALGDETRAASVPIAKAIMDVASALQLETVAEGIETQAQLDRLYAMGCTHVQGFLLAHPSPITSAVRFRPPPVRRAPALADRRRRAAGDASA